MNKPYPSTFTSAIIYPKVQNISYLSIRVCSHNSVRDLPAIVNEASSRLLFWRTSPSSVWSIAKAEIAKSIFFFLSNRLMERKFNLHPPPPKKKRKKESNSKFVVEKENIVKEMSIHSILFLELENIKGCTNIVYLLEWGSSNWSTFTAG